MAERDFGTIKPEAKAAAGRIQEHTKRTQLEKDASANTSAANSSSKLSRRHFLRNAVGATVALMTGAVGFTEAASRSQPLPSRKPQVQSTLEPTPQNEGEFNRQKMLHGIEGMLTELEGVDEMAPQPEMKVNISGEIITAFTVGGGPDQQKYSKKTLDLNMADKNNLHTDILEAKTILAFAKDFLAVHPDYTDVALQGWLRREYDFTLQVPYKSGASTSPLPVVVDTYEVSVMSTYSPDWEDIPDQTPGGLTRPQKKNFDFTVAPVTLGQPITSQQAFELGAPKQYSFQNGFDVEYIASPQSKKVRFLTGERGRGEASEDSLHFIQDYIVPTLASVHAEDESHLLNEDVQIALTP